MSIVMSGHETCKYGKKIERKNSWARECIFSSHRPQKSMKNKRINIKEEKFRILLENWSRYRSEEISPGVPAGTAAAKLFEKLKRSLGWWGCGAFPAAFGWGCKQRQTCWENLLGGEVWFWSQRVCGCAGRSGSEKPRDEGYRGEGDLAEGAPRGVCHRVLQQPEEPRGEKRLQVPQRAHAEAPQQFCCTAILCQHGEATERGCEAAVKGVFSTLNFGFQ